MRCLHQSSYRCGCPDGNRHAHVVHCHARTSHNRRYPRRHPWRVPAVYCSCGSSIRLSVILKGRPVSSEPSQPRPRARKSLLSDDAFMLWRVPCATMSAHRPEELCTRFRYPPGLPASSRTVPAREPSSSLTSTEEWPAAPYTPRSQTYRQPLF